MPISDINHEREKRRRARIALKRRQARRRRILFIFLLLLVGGIGVKIISNWSKSKIDFASANEAQWYILKNMDLEGTINPLFDGNIVNIRQSNIHNKLEIRLLKGENHINLAQDYAFDTREVKDYINGDKKYKGQDKWVFLTFDDGPNQSISPRILDILKEEGVPATFFVQGQYVTKKNKNILMREISEGHGIALHSFSHNYKTMYPGRRGDEKAIVREATKAQEALQKIISPDFHSSVWRYPGGHMSWTGLEGADEALSSLDIEWIDWNALSGDAERKAVRPTSPGGMVEYMKKSIAKNTNKDFIVVLMHDGEKKDLTVEALPSIIQELRTQGYSFGILK